MIVEAVALVLFVIGTPLAMFKDKNEDLNGDKGCLTMWGYKTKCSDKDYTIKVNEMFEGSGCESRKKTFHASEGLSIVSIVVFAACIVIALLMCCCSCLTCCYRIILMIVIVVGICTGAAAFACMAYVYNHDVGDLDDISNGTKTLDSEQEDTTRRVPNVASDSVGTFAALPSGTAGNKAHLINGSLPAFETDDPYEGKGICGRLKDIGNYGAGFALIVIGWSLHTVNIVFAVAPL